MEKNNGSLSASKVLKNFDSTWAFSSHKQNDSNRADEVILWNEDQAIPR